MPWLPFSAMEDFKTAWWQQQVDGLSDIFQELVVDDEPEQVKKAAKEAVDGWKEYHQKELKKWEAIEHLLNLQ